MALKQLMLPANRAFDSNGLPEAAAQVKLFLSGTTTPANFLASDGVTSLGSTLTANGAGRLAIQAYNDDGTAYRLQVLDAAGGVLDDLDPFYFGVSTDSATSAAASANSATAAANSASAASTSAANAASSASAAALAAGAASGTPVVTTRAALAALTATSGMTRQLIESGYEGVFVFSASDLSAQVTADPNKVSYVAPSTASTGASGAWVRTRVYDARLAKAFTHSLPVGDITLPAAFNNQLALTPYWDASAAQYPRNPYDAIDFTKYLTCNHYWVAASGNNTNAGTSSGAAWRTLPYAVANAISPAIIHIPDDYIGLTGFVGNASLQYSGMLKIKGEGTKTGRTRLLARRESETVTTFAWAASGSGGAYVSTVAAALRNYHAMFDANYVNAKGIGKPITAAADAATCQSTPGTFFYDGTANLYVHMWDGRIPDPDNGWLYSEPSAHFEIQQGLSTGSGVILLENLEFFYNVGSAGTAGCRYTPVTAGTANSTRFGRRNCLVYGAAGNGFETFDASIIVADNCHAYYNHIDNHNYHSFISTGTKGAYMTIYEHNCTSKGGGFTGWTNQNALSTSANGSTIHDMIHMLRTNGFHFDCNGSVVADVVASVSVNINVVAGHPNAGGSASPRACFWHDNGGFTPVGGMYLWGCAAHDDGDSATYLLDCGDPNGGGSGGQIYSKYWRGQIGGAVKGPLKDWTGAAL